MRQVKLAVILFSVLFTKNEGITCTRFTLKRGANRKRRKKGNMENKVFCYSYNVRILGYSEEGEYSLDLEIDKQ